MEVLHGIENFFTAWLYVKPFFESRKPLILFNLTKIGDEGTGSRLFPMPNK